MCQDLVDSTFKKYGSNTIYYSYNLPTNLICIFLEQNARQIQQVNDQIED